MKQTLCCTLLFLLMCTFAQAQTLAVKGNVVSKNDGEPIVGVTVVENGKTTNGTITDIDGNFTLTVPQGAELNFSSLGFKSVTIAATQNMKVQLVEDSELLDDVIVTGYMTEKKASLTGSVAVVKMKEVADIPTGNILTSLQGRVAGMNITTDGAPGGGNTSTLLRGVTTINNSSPLYVIDGIQTRDNIASILASNDVESIQVLKDAASAAIYGAQAANGVIIITTKKAKKGSVRVNFDASLSAQTFVQGIDMLDAYEWGDVYWQAYHNTYGAYPNTKQFSIGAEITF